MISDAILQSGTSAGLQGLVDLLSSPISLIVVVFAMALVPFLLLAVTSFVKLSVVFGILRNALGAQQIPSSAVTSLVALVLTFHIMSPVASESVRRLREFALTEVSSAEKAEKPSGSEEYEKKTSVSKAIAGIDLAYRALEVGFAPIRNFLLRHARLRERAFFAGMRRKNLAKESPASLKASRTRPEEGNRSAVPSSAGKGLIPLLPGEDTTTIIPAFLLSELRGAFEMGFTIFLPFLVVDLIVANILVGLGMMMVSPISIALPFKLVLFVLCDGWFLLCRGLVLSYA